MDQSRDIKFRARISEKGITLYFGLLDLLDPQYEGRKTLMKWLYDGNIPEEFIGVKDKNGVDIYEGDDTSGGVIIWRPRLGFDGLGGTHPGFYIKDVAVSCDGELSWHDCIDESIEVINKTSPKDGK